MEDVEIIQKVIGGDSEAFAGLVSRYQARVTRLCASYLGVADAEDAAQDVFVKAYQSLAQFQRTSSFYTWLYRIASNHCLSVLRGQSRRRTESWDALLEAHGERIQEVFSAAPDPRRALEAADLIAKVLSGLRPNYREILILREVEGLSYEEIGQVLECSIDSVKAQLRRGREELEEKLRHFIGRPGV